MKLELPVSFGAAVCFHAVVLFGWGLQTAPSVVSTDSGSSAMGLELIGAQDGEGVTQGEPIQEAEPVQPSEPLPSPDLATVQPAPEPMVTPEPEPLATPAEPPAEASIPAASTPPRPTLKPASGKGIAKAAPTTSPRGGRAAGGGSQRGGMGANGTGWDTEARPAYRHNPPPLYPAMALRARQQGTVLIRVEVSADGIPRDVKLSRGCGFTALDEAAIQAVRRWRFEPARLAGVPVPSHVEVPVAFNLLR